MSVAIQWFENSLFDAPELKSPQPCIHGAGCVYTKKAADGKVTPAVCRYVHPGEEGKGRRLFPARTITFEHPDGEDVVNQPACVRLIGNALYYERMSMRMPWQAFCAVRGIPFTANVAGQHHKPVKRVAIGSHSSVATASKTAYAPETITASGVRVRKRQECTLSAKSTQVVKGSPVLPPKVIKTNGRLQDISSARVVKVAEVVVASLSEQGAAGIKDKDAYPLLYECVKHMQEKPTSVCAVIMGNPVTLALAAHPHNNRMLPEHLKAEEKVDLAEKRTLKIAEEVNTELTELQQAIKFLESVD